tara:strand:- start:319 stop:627 length:309 start_codon:yes stop_codon:yes gene_type:complete
MTRFETETGESLGVTFFGGWDLGKLKFQTQTELELLWSLSDDEIVLCDNGWTGTISELKDLLFPLKQCTKEDMIKRGWGDRLESGLSLRQSVSDEGKLIWIR